MKIALLGLGGMGKTVRLIALARGHEVPVIIDPHNQEATSCCLSAEILNGVDVAIDFSSNEALFGNINICKKAGVNLVVGTTGWYDKLAEVKEMVEVKNAGTVAEENGGRPREGKAAKKNLDNANEIGFLWSSNFSIGVNLYFKMVEVAAKLVNKFDEYDVWGHEIHHYNKADSPSGTAKTLEKILLDNIERKKAVVEDKLDRKREPHEIHFSSVRGGPVNFGHTIGFDSAADRILITHEARCRDGYALGAVKAAEWLNGKKGYFNMEDFLRGMIE
ncbi:4-hydroxy-tetrahydrodipicolinate reductase [Candidatus Peregrinibacteria bacterium]|nr:4-hydroxy-tetrahydrodipicolinate reductase [Candidatus Peregrinibacteria bacterium]